MKKACYIFVVASGLLMFSSCNINKNITPPPTQLEIRQMQTRDYDTKDTRLVMKSLLNVLQDEGFIIKNATLDLGMISAEKSIDIENSSEAFFAKINGGNYAHWRTHMLVEISGNVSEYGDQTRIRINIQKKVYDNYGAVVDVDQIKDGEYYQKLFIKIDKGIFIQSEDL